MRVWEARMYIWKWSRKGHALEKPRERRESYLCALQLGEKPVIKRQAGCGGKELLPQETVCPTFFSHIWNPWIFYLLYRFPWFPAGQSWQLSLCFILNCSKPVGKWLTLLSGEVAAWLQEPPDCSPRPGGHWGPSRTAVIAGCDSRSPFAAPS